jgi:predicted transcriptional regulator
METMPINRKPTIFTIFCVQMNLPRTNTSKAKGRPVQPQIAKKLGLTTRATRNILHKLMEKGLVEAGGYGSTRRYAITK